MCSHIADSLLWNKMVGKTVADEFSTFIPSYFCVCVTILVSINLIGLGIMS